MNMRKFVAALLMFFALGAQAQVMTAGFGFGAQPNPLPLNRPLATSSSSIFTFLGSFKLPNGSGYFGAMSISGSTLYMSGTALDPYYSQNTDSGMGMQAVTIPTLSGTPAYDGSNHTGTATVTALNRPATTVAPAVYTLSTAPVAGNTTAVFSGGDPAGIAVGTGWYIGLEKSGATCPNNGSPTATTVELVTGWNGSTHTVTFAALPAGTYTTSACVHQWFPSQPFGYASGARITGSLPYNGNLLLTGWAYYDTTSTATLGWILQSNLASTSWGSVYTAAGHPTEYSRHYSGPLGIVPAEWQPLLGGPAYVVSAPGSKGGSGPLSMNGGYGFNTFDPSTISGTGGAATVTQVSDYTTEGAQTTRWLKTLAARSFTGPFPLCVSTATCSSGATTYFPATLATAPSPGATTATIATPAATSTVSVTANITTGQNAIVVTAINSGTISNSGISYIASGTGIPNNDYVTPAYDLGPTVSTNTCTSGTPCTFQLHTSATATATGESVTLTPAGYVDGYYQVTFSDGETRIGHLNNYIAGNNTFPVAHGGTDNIDPTSFAALTCSPSCTTAITIAPMGDTWMSSYQGPLGTAFIEPGSKSLLFIAMHQYGPEAVRADQCNSGQSGSNEIPYVPDPVTTYYNDMEVIAYNLQDLVNAKNGIASDTSCPNPTGTVGPYAACPYGTWVFPGSASLKTATNGCLFGGALGWAVYDPVGAILYATFSSSKYSASPIVYEWSVAPL